MITGVTAAASQRRRPALPLPTRRFGRCAHAAPAPSPPPPGPDGEHYFEVAASVARRKEGGRVQGRGSGQRGRWGHVSACHNGPVCRAAACCWQRQQQQQWPAGQLGGAPRPQLGRPPQPWGSRRAGSRMSILREGAGQIGEAGGAGGFPGAVLKNQHLVRTRHLSGRLATGCGTGCGSRVCVGPFKWLLG